MLASIQPTSVNHIRTDLGIKPDSERRGNALESEASLALFSGQAGLAARRSEHANVLSLRFSGLAVLANFESDLVTFSQGPTLLQGRYVNEHVRSTILRRNEAKSLVVIEKFNCTGSHENSF